MLSATTSRVTPSRKVAVHFALLNRSRTAREIHLRTVAARPATAHDSALHLEESARIGEGNPLKDGRQPPCAKAHSGADQLGTAVEEAGNSRSSASRREKDAFFATF